MNNFSSKEIDLSQCITIAQLAALKAGNRIMDYFGKDLHIENKGYGYEKSDLVTKADQEAQEIIEEHLHGFHPLIGFLGEENGHNDNNSRFEQPYFWSVDPLDGTKAFVSHNTGFAVSIGLTSRKGEAILGVSYFPARRELLYGISGQKAYLNDMPLTQKRNPEKIRLLLSEAETLSPLKNNFYNELCSLIKVKFPKSKISPETIVAPVEKGCLVAKSDTETLYYGIPRPKLGVSIWDFSAIVPIVEASGGYASDIFGSPLELNRSDSTFMHHNGFLLSSNKELRDIVISLAKKYEKKFQ